MEGGSRGQRSRQSWVGTMRRRSMMARPSAISRSSICDRTSKSVVSRACSFESTEKRDQTNRMFRSMLNRVQKDRHTDEAWLQSMLPGLEQPLRTRYNEHSYLLEHTDADQRRFVLLPWSRFRTCWDFLTLGYVLYTAVYMPYELAFLTQSGNSWSATKTLDFIQDAIFLVDIFLNFHTAYIRYDSTLVISKSMITRNYLTTWFPIDAAGSIPWEFIFLFAAGSSNGDSGGQSLGVLRALKLPKLLRLGRLFKFLSRFEKAANLGQIFILVMLMMLLIHWCACLYFMIASLRLEECLEGSPEGCAVDWLTEKNIRGKPNWDMYVFTYYWTMLMLMGDGVDPTTDLEAMFVVGVGLIGACVNAIIFANVASLVSQMSAVSAAHQSRMDEIDRAMRALKLDQDTKLRIRDYFQYIWSRHKDFASFSFMSRLPEELRSRTACLVFEKLLRSCPLFAQADRKFVAALCVSLHPEVYLPSQFIRVAGHVSRAMYFIQRGRVQLIERIVDEGDERTAGREFSAAGVKDSTFKIKECDLYFDMVSLFVATPNFSIRSLTHTDCFRLTSESLSSCLKQFPRCAIQVAEATQNGCLTPVQSKVALKWIADATDLPAIVNKVALRAAAALLRQPYRHWTPARVTKMKALAKEMILQANKHADRDRSGFSRRRNSGSRQIGPALPSLKCPKDRSGSRRNNSGSSPMSPLKFMSSKTLCRAGSTSKLQVPPPPVTPFKRAPSCSFSFCPREFECLPPARQTSLDEQLQRRQRELEVARKELAEDSTISTESNAAMTNLLSNILFRLHDIDRVQEGQQLQEKQLVNQLVQVQEDPNFAVVPGSVASYQSMPPTMLTPVQMQLERDTARQREISTLRAQIEKLAGQISASVQTQQCETSSLPTSGQCQPRGVSVEWEEYEA